MIISHETMINAPADNIWKEIIAIDDWEWNKWTRLKAERPEEGIKGQLKASYDGNNNWKQFDFTFGPVDESQYLLTWVGSIGPKGCIFYGYHTMQLEVVNDTETKLIHREEFGGLLPKLGLGLPYKKLDRNYLLMNEELKQCVEEKYNAGN